MCLVLLNCILIAIIKLLHGTLYGGIKSNFNVFMHYYRNIVKIIHLIGEIEILDKL